MSRIFPASAVKEEVHQRGEHQQGKQETEDGPAIAVLTGSGGAVSCVQKTSAVPTLGLKPARWLEVLGIVEGSLAGARVCGEARLPVREYLYVYVSGPSLFCQRLRQLLGQKVLANDACQLFCERVRDLFVAGSFDRRCVRIAGMEGESIAWLGFNVEVELQFLISRGKVSGGTI